jgi:prepilin-type N-terminal cleavage/methylation domain-containing protein
MVSEKAPMECRWVRRNRVSSSAGGFTLLEVLIVVAISFVLVALSLPLVQNTFAYFRLRGAVSSVTGAIQSTRYQALQNGYPYAIALNAAARTYQVQDDPTNAGLFVNVGNTIPLSGSGDSVALDADKSFTFRPSGRVTSPQADANGNTTLTLTARTGRTATITVSRYGNVNVTFAP